MCTSAPEGRTHEVACAATEASTCYVFFFCVSSLPGLPQLCHDSRRVLQLFWSREREDLETGKGVADEKLK